MRTDRIIPAALILCLAVLPLPGRAQQPQQPPPPPPPQQQEQQQPPPPAPPSQPQRRVRAIEIRGNRHISAEQILAAVTNTKVGEPLNDEKLREDLRAIIDLGWFADVSVRLENEEEDVRVVFIVTENPVIAEVVVEGNTAIPAEEIRSALGVPVGEVLNLRRMREGALAVQKLYEERGYVLAHVQDIGLIPAEGPEDRGRLRIRIVEGTIEAVRFEGMRRTREQVVRRHLTVKPGDVFNINELNRDLQRLFDLGLFESIRARPEPGSTPDSAIIVIEVKEARTAQITGGVGYSTAEGVLGFVEYRDRNWRGLSQTLAVRAERSVTTGLTTGGAGLGLFNYEVTFTEPFLDERTGVQLSLYSRASEDSEYSGNTKVARFYTQRTGSLIAFTRPLDDITVASLRFKSELTGITALPINPTDPPCAPTCPLPSLLTPGRVVSFQLGGTRDTRSDRFTPISGSKIALSTEFGVRALGGDFGFGKYTAEYQHYIPLGRNSTVLGRVFAGISSGSLPAQELFILGGPSTVRSLASAQLRGNNVYVANLEFNFPLGSVLRFLGETRGIVFADAGRCAGLCIPAETDLKVGYGVGVALKTPLGPIRIDIAFGPGRTQTWLSLGSPFP